MIRHFDLTLRRCTPARPRSNTGAARSGGVRIRPDALFWSDYPETEGRTAFPFHTKARNLARLLVGRDRLTAFDLAAPLPNSIDFSAPPETQRSWTSDWRDSCRRVCVSRVSRRGVDRKPLQFWVMAATRASSSPSCTACNSAGASF